MKSIRSELERRQIPASQMAREMGISRQRLSSIMIGKGSLGSQVEARLSDWLAQSQNCKGEKA